jgi:hypothetical protein
VGAAALALVPATAWGDTLHVTSEKENGPGSLGRTITDAGFQDTIVVPAGHYPLTHGDTLLDQENVIRGAGVGVTFIEPTGGGEAITEGENVIDATVTAPEHPQSSNNGIETKAQIIAVIVTLAIFLLILDLVRRRRLAERYALLWMLAAAALLVLSAWTEGLDVIADAMGIQQPANAIFLLAFAIIFILLLHFSVATTRLAEETKILAQESARLEQELREARGEVPSGNGSAPSESADVADRGT